MLFLAYSLLYIVEGSIGLHILQVPLDQVLWDTYHLTLQCRLRHGISWCALGIIAAAADLGGILARLTYARS